MMMRQALQVSLSVFMGINDSEIVKWRKYSELPVHVTVSYLNRDLTL